ncbi:Gp49 family protein [Burkholderia gladioli]|uniref:Gp49 family protein n=1 Tax=Burkholderia gladioli TaxID=28095 RepID=UPI003015EBBD
MNDNDIEREIRAKGKTAARVTPADIDASIAGEYFFTAADATKGCPQFEALSLLTFCVLVLRNGFTVTGESACASPENFDAEIGRKIARQNAVAKIWRLEGYLLKQRLYEER